MKHPLRFLQLGIIVGATFFAASLSPAAEAPPFIVVGHSYSVVAGSQYQITVLEILKDGWIKVVVRQQNRIAWINTNALPVIGPYPPQPPR